MKEDKKQTNKRTNNVRIDRIVDLFIAIIMVLLSPLASSYQFQIFIHSLPRPLPLLFSPSHSFLFVSIKCFKSLHTHEHATEKLNIKIGVWKAAFMCKAPGLDDNKTTKKAKAAAAATTTTTPADIVNTHLHKLWYFNFYSALLFSAIVRADLVSLHAPEFRNLQIHSIWVQYWKLPCLLSTVSSRDSYRNVFNLKIIKIKHIKRIITILNSSTTTEQRIRTAKLFYFWWPNEQTRNWICRLKKYADIYILRLAVNFIAFLYHKCKYARYWKSIRLNWFLS